MDDTKQTVKKLHFRTRILMAEKGVRTVTELGKKLEALGVTISVSQLGRIIDGKSAHIDRAVLEGMLAVFDCGIVDLLEVK
jgi:DNA-binding Xre family transcriptional regulator